MIKVLHVYPKNDSLMARYIHLLMEKYPAKATDDAVEFRQTCKEWQPDIVHQHKGVTFVGKGNYRLVISPCGEPVDRSDYYAIIARSPLEADTLHQKGMKRVEIVRNPLITKTTNFSETAQKLSYVYQKVMDSNPLPLMNTDTRNALAVVLKASITGDKRWIDPKLPISSIQYRQLYIYALHEGVLPFVEKGLNVMDVSPPPREQTASYLPDNYKKPQSIVGKSIPEMLTDIRQNGLSLLRICELGQALMDDHLDEEKLIKLLEQENINLLFRRILQILKEQICLDEGFMPNPPLDDKVTQRLRLQLINHLKL